MATYEKRKTLNGEFTYRAKVRLDGHPGVTRTFTRLAPAKAWATSIEHEMRNGAYAVGSGRTVLEAIEAYATEILPTMKDTRMKTVHLTHWKARLGKHKLRDLNRHMIADALDALAGEPQAAKKRDAPARPRVGATINRYRANLSSVLTFAVCKGWLASNPAKGIGNRAESRGRTRFLTPGERDQLLAKAKESRSADLYLAVVLSLATGGRQAEVLGLRWPCVNLDRGVVTFLDTKNGSDRAVPLVPVLVELLRERQRVCRSGTGLIFPSKLDHQKPVDLRQGFRAVCHRAGVSGFRWHDQRHSAASALADMGASLLDIGTVLGHRSQQTTKRYAHLTESRLRDLVERAAEQHRVA